MEYFGSRNIGLYKVVNQEEISRRVSLELTAQHQKAIDQLERDHEQRLQEQLQKTRSDYEQRMQQLVKEHEDALAGAQQMAQVTGGMVGVFCGGVRM